MHNLHQVPLVGLTCGLIGHHLLERDLHMQWIINRDAVLEYVGCSYHVFVRLDADLRSWVGAGGDKRVVRDATLSWT